MKNGLLVILAYLAFFASTTASCQDDVREQDATVLFYSHGSALAMALPSTTHGYFVGHVYDGPQELFYFKGSLAHPILNRFAVFHLAAGSHTFSASRKKHPDKNAELTINLEAGKIYFFRAQGEYPLLGLEKGRLDLVTCPVAHQEIGAAKAFDAEAISAAAMPRWDSAQTLLPCP